MCRSFAYQNNSELLLQLLDYKHTTIVYQYQRYIKFILDNAIFPGTYKFAAEASSLSVCLATKQTVFYFYLTDVDRPYLSHPCIMFTDSELDVVQIQSTWKKERLRRETNVFVILI